MTMEGVAVIGQYDMVSARVLLSFNVDIHFSCFPIISSPCSSSSCLSSLMSCSLKLASIIGRGGLQPDLLCNTKLVLRWNASELLLCSLGYRLVCIRCARFFRLVFVSIVTCCIYYYYDTPLYISSCRVNLTANANNGVLSVSC